MDSGTSECENREDLARENADSAKVCRCIKMALQI